MAWRAHSSNDTPVSSSGESGTMEKKSIFRGHLHGLVATRYSSYALVGKAPHQTRKQVTSPHDGFTVFARLCIEVNTEVKTGSIKTGNLKGDLFTTSPFKLPVP